MFASGFLPASLFALLLFKTPESPRWLMEQMREDEARTNLDRVAGLASAQTEMNSIRNALSQEKGTWMELCSQKLSVPLVMGILLAILQQVTGINVFMYFGTTLFKEISQLTGVDAGMIQQPVIGVAGILFTVIAITVIDKWGRKPLMFIGTGGMFIGLVAMGGMDQTMKNPATAGTLMLLCIILAAFCMWMAGYAVTQTFPIMDKNAWLV